MQLYIYKYPHAGYTSEPVEMAPAAAKKQILEWFPELVGKASEEREEIPPGTTVQINGNPYNLESGAIQITFKKKAGTKG